MVRRACAEDGAPFAVCDGYEQGGEGAEELAKAVMEHAESGDNPFHPLYDWAEPIPQKMEKIASTMYGAAKVSYTKRAKGELKRIEQLGYADLPLCVAKTPTSLTDDGKRAGRPTGFEITVTGFVVSAGAGFVVPLLGDIVRMPGLPRSPQAERIDLVNGEARGLMMG